MISELLLGLERNKDEERAIQMKAYMRNQFEYFGIPSKLRKDLSRTFIRSFAHVEFRLIKRCIYELWNHEKRECQYIAMDLLSRHLKQLKIDDSKFLEKLILTKSWWDTVDWLAGHGVGKYLEIYPDQRKSLILKWSDTENIWLIRSCILFQLFYKEKTDTKILEEIILGQTGTKEFFINKASGWALRQYSKVNPKWITHFVNKHQSVLHKLTQSEALKWMQRNNLKD